MNWLAKLGMMAGILAPVVLPTATAKAPAAYDELTSMIAKNPATGRPVQSMDELLPLLSEELRSNFTFVYDSRSPHRESVEAANPRTVLFTKDGRLSLAFNGNPKKPGYGTIETIHFDDETASFALAKFVLPEAGGSPDNGVLNPPQCLRCHGSDPRPITDSYPLWPGFYGSVRDTFPKGSPELPLYRKFIAEQSKQGVYRHLKFPAGSSVSPYLDPKDFDSEKVVGKTGELKFLPNTRLGMAWTELNRKRLQRKLRSSPEYLAHRLALLSGLLECEKLPISVKTEEAVYAGIWTENENRLVRLGFRPTGPEKSELDMMELAMYQNVAQILYLGKVLKVDTSDWSLALEPKSYSYFDGILSGMATIRGKDKNFYLKEDFILELLADVVRDDARFAKYLSTYGSYAEDGYPFGKRLDLVKAVGACKILKGQVAKKHLPKFDIEAPRTRTLSSAAVIMKQLDISDAPFRRCTECHEGEGALRTARPIPFSNPSELWTALQAESESGKPLRAEIEERLSLRGDGQMPPRGSRLSETEKESLRRYLTAVEQG